MKNMSRRSFITGVAVLGGSLALSGCSSSSTDSNPKADSTPLVESLDFDVVVLGAGLAGLGAAGAAAANGAKVALVEKGSMLLSAFWPSPGNLAIAQLPENESDWLFTSAIPDTKEDFLLRWKTATEVGAIDVAYPDYDRVTNLMMESCNTISWIEELGLPFEQSMDKAEGAIDGMKPIVPETTDETGGLMIGNVFQELFDNTDTTLLFDTAGTELVMDGEKVVGVIVEGAKGAQTLNAKAVVLATGGFAGSDQFRSQYIPEVDEAGCRFVGLTSNEGDGITMSSAADAALYEDGWIIPSSLIVSEALSNADASLGTLKAPKSGIYVDVDGNRFVDEAAKSTVLATTMIDSKKGPYYGLFDSSDAETVAALELGLSTDDLFKGETIEDLASVSQMNNLPATFAAYQAAVETGIDADFSKPAEEMVAYAEEGPYYLARFVPSYVATMGGLKTTEESQAIDSNDKPIEGLYAIGEIAHRFMYNRSFIPSASNGGSITMGRLLGEHLAQNIIG